MKKYILKDRSAEIFIVQMHKFEMTTPKHHLKLWYDFYRRGA